MRSNLRSTTFLAVLAIAGCSSGSSTTTDSGAGSVAVGLTLAGDLPKLGPDLVSVAHAEVTLKAIDLHIVPADQSGPADDEADDDASWRTVTLPPETHFDLMTLQNGVIASLGHLTALPAGKITQIRLVLDEEGPHGVVLADGDKCTLDLSHVPETGIRIVHPFAAIDFDGHTPIRIVLDLDVVSSLREVAPCDYVLDPVIRVDHVDDDSDGNPGATEDTDEQGQEGEH